MKDLIERWFEKWESGDYLNLPISVNFEHTSPFGTIKGKQSYIDLVSENKDKFLGYRFIIHDVLYDIDRACARYTAIQNDFTLEVSEWYKFQDGLIEQIIAYYHIGDIQEERNLK